MRPVIVYSLVLATLGVVALLSLNPQSEEAQPPNRGLAVKVAHGPFGDDRVPKNTARPVDLEDVERRAVKLTRAGDIQEAMRLFELLTGAESLDFEWRAFAQRLAGEAPEAGYRWLCRLPSTDQTRSAMSLFGMTLDGRDPALARKFLDELPATKPEPALRDAFCSGVIRAEAAHSLDGAYELVDKVGRSKSEKEDFLRGLAGQIGMSDQHETLLKMAERSPDETDPIFVGGALYKLWKKDPAAAQQWIERLPDSMRVAEACNTLAYEFAHDAPGAAAEWVKTLPAGEIRDRSILGLARAISNAQPLESLRWAVSVEGERNRAAGVSTLLGPAIAKDLAAARQIVENSTLSPAEKTKWAGFIEEAIPVWKPAK